SRAIACASLTFAPLRSGCCRHAPLQRPPSQKPTFLVNPLFDRVGLLEISLRIRCRHRYRSESIAKPRVRLKNCRKRRVAEFRRRHLPSLLGFKPKAYFASL